MLAVGLLVGAAAEPVAAAGPANCMYQFERASGLKVRVYVGMCAAHEVTVTLAGPDGWSKQLFAKPNVDYSDKVVGPRTYGVPQAGTYELTIETRTQIFDGTWAVGQTVERVTVGSPKATSTPTATPTTTLPQAPTDTPQPTTEPTPAVTTEPTPVVTTSPSAPAPAAALTSPSCEDQPAPIETTPAASDPGIDAAVAVGLIAVAVALGLLGGLRPWSRRSSS